jgi:hypothetical protein
MLNRHRLSLAAVTVISLFVASAASAIPDGPFVWSSVGLNEAAPTVTIDAKPSNPSNVASATFAFSANRPSTFECKLDTAAFESCTSPKPYTGLGDGSHTFEVKATSANAETGSATYTWTVDTTAPTAAITGQPALLSNDNTPSFAFSANESGSTFTCRVDAAARSCSSGVVWSRLADGLHTFGVKATDPVGNTGAEAVYTWTIDTAGPAAPSITGKPGNPSNNRSPSFAFTGEGSAFFCRLDAAPRAPCSSGVSYARLADGSHTFTVRAIDLAGNPGAEASYTWTIDTVPPAAPAITGKPNNPSNTRSPSFTFTASGGSTFCRLDTGVAAPCTSPISYSNIADGPHTFGVKAIDPAGNASAEATYIWTIETRAPTAALVSTPSGLSNSSAAMFAFAADEPSSFDCKLDNGGFDPCTSPATYHGLGDGAHAFTVRARDAVGNFSPPVAYSWAIDTTAPETTLASAPKSGTATTATFTFSANEGGTFECRLDGAPFALCSSPKSYSGLSKTGHQFEVRAIDTAGNADATPALHAWRVTAPAAKKTRSALLSPAAGARVTRPPLLTWRRVPRARYYNVQVYRGSRKVFSAWPTRTRLQLRQQWKYLGRTQRLTPGRYRWYVWPGYTNPRRYGALLGQSNFVVRRAVRR